MSFMTGPFRASRSLAPKHVGRKEIICAPSFSRRPRRIATSAVASCELKKVESANRELDWEDEVLVCVNCGHELSYTVAHNHTAPHAKVA